MIKAIIFDCFGVLATDGWLPFRRQHFGRNAELFEAATALNKKTDAGLMGYDDFIRDLAHMAKMSEKETRLAIENNVPETDLFDYIRDKLKPQYKIGMLSNAGGDWLGELFSKEQVKLFDAVALSYETGFVKPDERAFHVIAERLGIGLNECIFTDDQERYCSGAKSVGMQAILYKNFDQFSSELDNLIASENKKS